jgi:uncharacterized C2H2 Zn-finger protein
MFQCEKCDITFKTKYDYNRHVNKKIPCNKDEKEQYDIVKRTCQHCMELYANPQSLGKHLPICKMRPNENEELKQIIAQLSNKIDDMSQQMKGMKPITINNNIQNNIIVTPFGKEDLSFLTVKDYTRILNKGCYSIPELLKLIHCNDNKPEYRNVYIKNFKDEYMFTFDGQDWGVERKDDVFANMIENKKNFLESKLDDMQGKLPEYAIKMFHKFLEQSDDNEVIASIKDELKSLFYKNRNHVMNTTKTVKKPKQITNTEIITETIKKPKHIAKIEIVTNIEKKPKKVQKIKA